MEENLTNKTAPVPQPKSDSKGKAVASFVFGIINLLPPALILLTIFLVRTPQFTPRDQTELMKLAITLAMLLSFATGVLGLIGLVLGIMGVKSTKRNFAIAGIILCTIGLLILLAGYYIYFIYMPPRPAY